MGRVMTTSKFMANVVRAIERTLKAKESAPLDALPSLDAALDALYGAVMVAVFTSS
jgi:hypothetical protein